MYPTDHSLPMDEEKLHTMLNSIADLVYTLDRDINLTGIYGHWLDQFDLTQDDLVGKSLLSLFGPDFERKHREHLNHVLSGQTVIFQWQMIGPQSIITFQTILSPLWEKKMEQRPIQGKNDQRSVLGMVAVARDISESVTLHETLTQSLRELDCLYTIAKLTQDPTKTLDQIFTQIPDIVREGLERSEDVHVKVLFDHREYLSTNYGQTKVLVPYHIIVGEIIRGMIELGLSEGRGDQNELILEEVDELIQTITFQLARLVQDREKTLQLRKNEELLREMFDKLPGPAYLWQVEEKPQGNYRISLYTANKPAFQLSFGLFPAYGQELADTFGDYPAIVADITHVAQSKESMTREYLVLGKNQVVRWYEFDYASVTNDQVLLIMHDITERKLNLQSLSSEVEEKNALLVEQNARVEAIIETISDGIMVVDNRGTILLVNNLFNSFYHKLTQMTIVPGTNIDDLRPNPITSAMDELRKRKSPDSITIQLEDEQFLQIESASVNINSTDSATSTSTIYEIRDVSKFIKFDQVRRRFVSTVSHELRTPITSIFYSIKNVQKYKDRLRKEDEERLMTAIEHNTEIMVSLVEDLLAISRFDEGRQELKKEEFQLAEVIEETIAHLQVDAAKKKICCDTELDRSILLVGDKDKIQQVLRIVISNAIKFAHEKTVVEVRTNHRPSQNSVVVEVIDEGVGILESELPSLFERFFRGSNIRNIQGTGLGLAIAKEIINLHNGCITIQNNSDKSGALVKIQLPLDQKAGTKKKEMG